MANSTKQVRHLAPGVVPPNKPTMVWDGDCAFCARWIERWRRRTGDRIQYEKYQEIDNRFAPLSDAHYRRSVYLIEPDGDVTAAAEAVFRSLYLGGNIRVPYQLYRTVPLFAIITERGYEFVARNRNLLARLGL